MTQPSDNLQQEWCWKNCLREPKRGDWLWVEWIMITPHLGFVKSWFWWMSLSSCKVEYVGSTTSPLEPQRRAAPSTHTQVRAQTRVCVCVVRKSIYRFEYVCVCDHMHICNHKYIYMSLYVKSTMNVYVNIYIWFLSHYTCNMFVSYVHNRVYIHNYII